MATGEPWLFLLPVPLANLCMCILFARTASGPNPLVARLAAEVVALRQPGHPLTWACTASSRGATWLRAGIFPAAGGWPGGDMVTEPAKMFLVLSTALPSLVGAGTGASALWFFSVLRRRGVQAPFRSSLNPAAATGSP